MNNSMKIGLVKVTLFSILLTLSGMAAIASADFVTPIGFYGTATLNDEPATTGMVINAYIDEEPSGTSTIMDDGQYHINVRGNESDEGELITFEICGATADQTDTWHASANSETRLLNLTAVDDVAPAVTNATATPPSIVANGTDATQLSVTVIDGCRCTVGTVTVNLSAIGGDAAQAMTRIGDTDVYSVTVNATEGTALGAHYLYVNASDVFGWCNTSVCISLGVTPAGLPQTGDIDDDGDITMNDVIYLAKHYYGTDLFPDYGTLYADGDIDCDDDITMNDVIYLAKHYYGTDLFPDYGTLYPCE